MKNQLKDSELSLGFLLEYSILYQDALNFVKDEATQFGSNFLLKANQ